MLTLAVSASDAQAEGVDRVVVRFHSPETGGPIRPRFVTERFLSYEARLEMLAEQINAPQPLDRHVRAALDHHVAETMLAALPLDRPPSSDELTEAILFFRQATAERTGSDKAMTDAAAVEGISRRDVEAMLTRQARAAVYVDRAISPILKPSDDQLREIYRTAAHPYRRLSFDEAREKLTRWFVLERFRVAEGAFLHSARARVRVTVIPREEGP